MLKFQIVFFNQFLAFSSKYLFQFDLKLLHLNLEHFEGGFHLKNVGSVQAIQAICPHNAFLCLNHLPGSQIKNRKFRCQNERQNLQNLRIQQFQILSLADLVKIDVLISQEFGIIGLDQLFELFYYHVLAFYCLREEIYC